MSVSKEFADFVFALAEGGVIDGDGVARLVRLHSKQKAAARFASNGRNLGVFLETLRATGGYTEMELARLFVASLDAERDRETSQ